MKMRVLCALVLIVGTNCSTAIPDIARVAPGQIRKSDNSEATIQDMEEDTVEVLIEIEGKENLVAQLVKQKGYFSRGFGSKRVEVYADEHVLVRIECAEDNPGAPCNKYGLVHNRSETTYVRNDGRALVLKNKEGIIDSLMTRGRERTLEKVRMNQARARAAKAAKAAGSRRKRAIVDTLTNTRVIKLLAFVDKGLVDLFLELNNNDLNATKDDVIRYLTLVSNEMTLHIQTLRQYNQTMLVDGVEMDMDLAVSLVNVVFPPDGGNFDFSESNLEGNHVYMYKTQQDDGSYVKSGVWIEFVDYVKNNYLSNVGFDYDHAMLITGYDFRKRTVTNGGSVTEANYLGLAYQNTLCRNGKKNRAEHTSIVELDGTLGRIAIHEIGHGIGILHDSSNNDPVNCADKTYIMTKTMFNPTTDAADTYHRFSACSAGNLNAYTHSIQSRYFIDTCLKPADEIFLSNFCHGFVGTGLTLEEQCQADQGLASYRIPEDDQALEAILQAGYVQTCLADPDFITYPFRCLNLNSGNARPERLAATGTPCTAPDGAATPGYVCFNGQCVSQPDVC